MSTDLHTTAHGQTGPQQEQRGRTAGGGRWTAWLGVATSLVTLGTFAVAYTTPPRSGPLCASGCIGPPYTDAGQFVPRDYLWMYPALLVTLLLLAVVITVQVRLAAPRRPVVARTATGLAVIAAGTLSLDYGLQLTVLQPALARGEAAGMGFLTQYHPYGVFIGLENVGYTVMALALLFAGLAMVPVRRSERVLRWILVGGGLVTLAALVAFATIYGSELEYRYELAAISVTWLTLALTGITLAWQQRQGPGHAGRPSSDRGSLSSAGPRGHD